jgi:hypothetical protein
MKSGAIAPPFLTSVLHGGEWSASHPDLFIVSYCVLFCDNASISGYIIMNGRMIPE